MQVTTFRYAVVFLVALAYVLIGVTIRLGDSQLREGQRLQCTIAVAQVTAVRAALSQHGQPGQLQAARREVLASWQQLARSYGCREHP